MQGARLSLSSVSQMQGIAPHFITRDILHPHFTLQLTNEINILCSISHTQSVDIQAQITPEKLPIGTIGIVEIN
jgi:hypothetical protein